MSSTRVVPKAEVRNTAVDVGENVFAGWIGSISKDVVTPSIGVYTSEPRIICSNTCAIWRVSKKGQSVGPRPYLTLILSTKGGHGKVHSKGLMLKKEGKPYCLTASIIN